MLGVVNIRGQIIPVIDLPAIVGCVPKTGLNIMLVTEFARNAQAFAVEAVEDIVRLDWNQVLPAEQGVANGKVTSIARMDSDLESSRLIQVLDVESILSEITPGSTDYVDPDAVGGSSTDLKPGQIILAADDSGVARALIEQSLDAMGAPYVMAKSGKEAWDKLNQITNEMAQEGKSVKDKVGLVLTDLEMPELDGFTLTKMIKQDQRMGGIPVVIHSSLTGSANEAHVRNVGADAYVAKFEAGELAAAIQPRSGRKGGGAIKTKHAGSHAASSMPSV